jgi:cytoplasmic iron level regulating protein YaaA (DUF328/UPF0246 family)
MATVRRGAPVDPSRLSFPELAPTRAAVLRALIEVSGRPDATRRLLEPESMSPAVRRNLNLLHAPTAAVERMYSGVLYDALALANLDPASRRRARGWTVIVSALWGAVRLTDRVPPYRLGMCGRLPGLDHLTDVWRGPLEGVLPAAARRGLIVDCRSSEYATAWRPRGELADRTVVVKIFRERDGLRSAVSHNAKRTRGMVVRTIITQALDRSSPAALAQALSPAFEADLVAPTRPHQSWQLQVLEPPA